VIIPRRVTPVSASAYKLPENSTIPSVNNQPAIRVDYQPKQSLRMTVKYAGEKQRKQTFPGSLPGFNDTRMHDPVVTTIAIPVNYNLNASTFFEVNYGYARNAVAGCVKGNIGQALPIARERDPAAIHQQHAAIGQLERRQHFISRLGLMNPVIE